MKKKILEMLSNSLHFPFSKIKQIYLQLGLLSPISGEL